MAQWQELTLHSGKFSPEIIEEALLEAGAIAVTLTDAEDSPVLEPLPGETPLWPNTLITGLFEIPCDLDHIYIDLLRFLATDKLPLVKKIQLEDKDWVRAWMDHYKPMQFGENLWICPTHMSPPDPNAITIMLDPGLAFGTGTHPTTALCLQWLNDHANEYNNEIMIDYGCGSGVLAIAAKLLGAKEVFGTDIDEQAITATLNNALSNHVEVQACLPSVFSPPKAKVTIANILAGPLIALAPILANLTQIHGHLVLAGLLERDAELVKAAYVEWFDFQADKTLDGWTRLYGVKRG